jgi:UDP-N-acetylmuramoyl-L-alanyl-D-glutamate--2,6-diaminopimelate ligase
MSRVDQLIAQLHAKGISGGSLCADSRQVRSGDLFLAYPGATADGRDYVAQAVSAGAVAVIAEKVSPGGVASPLGTALEQMTVPVIELAGLASLCGEFAAKWYGHPSHKLWLTGITGTNGKTSISQWIAQALTVLGERTAVIGTLGNGFYGELVDSPNTTPDALVLQAALSDFVERGATCCAMEVSSIGIEEQRINGVEFAVAVFTNLTQDHLDYHGSMEAYAEAKAKLFSWPGLRAAVVNLDDPFGLQLLARVPASVRCIGYSLNPSVAMPARPLTLLCPEQLSFSGSGVGFLLDGVEFTVPVVGRFNAANVLAVIGALREQGHSLTVIADALKQLKPPPGRMEALGGNEAPLVVIDYAHTPDALEKALGVLRETADLRGGKLHCVFGCGGDRDAGKRPKMGAVAQAIADSVVVTSDNPRSEDPQRIIADVLAGMKPLTASEPDRRVAIQSVISSADKLDVVLIAGKGHEPYQEIAGVRHPFSDLAEAKSALVGWHPPGGQHS